MMSNNKVNASTHRWISELAEFHFTVHYRTGPQHGDADCLSRLPLDIEGYRGDLLQGGSKTEKPQQIGMKTEKPHVLH